VGLTGTVSRIFRKYLSNIPGNYDIEELCTAVILDTAQLFGNSVM
jgi:hypothetical protein